MSNVSLFISIIVIAFFNTYRTQAKAIVQFQGKEYQVIVADHKVWPNKTNIDLRDGNYFFTWQWSTTMLEGSPEYNQRYAIEKMLYTIKDKRVVGAVYTTFKMKDPWSIKQIQDENSTVYQKYSEEDIELEEAYLNGIRHGLALRYFKTDHRYLLQKSPYKNGKIDGATIHYHENGQEHTRYTFANGIKTSSYQKIFNSEGRLVAEGKEDCGKRGKWNFYYPNGKTLARGTFGSKSKLQGQEGRVGQWKFYNESGMLLEQVQFTCEVVLSCGYYVNEQHNATLDKVKELIDQI